jgi:uncharacterized protein YndB with AHSA1/START domain
MSVNKEEPIVTEQTYRASADRVWNAITDPTQMKEWFFSPIAAFEPEVGFETEFVVRSGGQDYPHMWRVTDVVLGKKIVYDWKYGGVPGESLVTWEIFETSEGAKLRVTHSGHETFPRNNEVFSRKAGEAGWSYFLNESLKTYLER